MNHGRGDGGEGVIVTELDFGDGKGIVLIDNGDDTNVQELIEGILSVDIAGALGGSMLAETPGNVRKMRGLQLTSAMSFLVRRIWAMG